MKNEKLPGDVCESKGRTVDEAVSEALLQLGARRDEVQIEVLDEGKDGLFGLIGRRSARVRVRRRGGARARQDAPRSASAGDRGRGSDRGRGQDRGRGSDRGGRHDGGNRGAARVDGQQRPDRGRDEGRGRDGRSRDGGGRDAGGRGRDERPRQDPRQGGRPESRVQEPRFQEPRRAEAAGAEPREDGERRSSRRRRPRGKRPEGDAAPAARLDAHPDAGAAPGLAASPGIEFDREAPARAEAFTPPAAAVVRDTESAFVNRSESFGEDRRESPQQERPAMHEENTPPAPAAARVDRDAAAGEPVVAVDLVQPRRGVPLAEAAETQRRYAEELMVRCGFPCRVTVNPGDYNQVKLVTDEDSADVLIGRRFYALDSLEHLVDRMATVAMGEHASMSLDINNHRLRLDGRLVTMAAEAMDRARREGQPVHLPPMNPRERRVVHMEVARCEGLMTETEGEGYDRHVIVRPDDGSRPAAEDES